MPGSPSGARALCAKAEGNASSAALRTLGHGAVPAPGRASPAPLPIIGAWAPRRIALVGSGSVSIPRDGRTGSPWRSGGKSVPGSPSPSGSPRHTGAGAGQTPLRSARPWRLSRRHWARCARGGPGSWTVTRRAFWTRTPWRRGSSAFGNALPPWTSSGNNWRMKPPCTRSCSALSDGSTIVRPRGMTDEERQTGRRSETFSGPWCGG